MGYESERSVAIRAVLKASRLCQSVRASLVSEETIAKKDKSPVTVADFGAQAIICLELMNAFPDDPVMAEEDAATLHAEQTGIIKARVVEQVNAEFPGLGEGEILSSIDHGSYDGGARSRFWTLDPIDGTKGFLRGEQYAIALALVEDGQVVLGVLGCPNLPLDQNNSVKGCLLAAVKGEGAGTRGLDNPEEIPVRVTEISDPARASFCESVESSHSSHGDAARIAEILGVLASPIRIDSQCKYAVIARGDASIYMRLPTTGTYMEKIWDHAAGSIIVKEAGGRVTDAYGNPLDFSLGRGLENNTGILATNSALHSRVIGAIGQVIKPKT